MTDMKYMRFCKILVWVFSAFILNTHAQSLGVIDYQDKAFHHSFASHETYTVKGVSFKMVKIIGGVFQMGKMDIPNDNSHQEILSDYYICETEVTQELWQAVMGYNPSWFSGSGKLPVENVSWNDCQKFIKRLNKMTGKHFRLPTEGEWEYAARGGTISNGYKYAGSNNVDDVAWHYGNSKEKTHKVGTKAPNELGLFDMSGNVWEWCQDRYGSYLECSDSIQSSRPQRSYRIVRGGSWYFHSSLCSISYRNYSYPSIRNINYGFRLAL